WGLRARGAGTMTLGTSREIMSRAERPSIDSGEPLRVLLVEDNAADSELVLRELKRAGFDVTSEWVQAAEEFRLILEKFVPDIVLADYNLGQWRGMEALEIIRNKALDSPLILVSGALGEVTSRAAQAGGERAGFEGGRVGPLQSRPGTVRLCRVPRSTGTAAHGGD